MAEFVVAAVSAIGAEIGSAAMMMYSVEIANAAMLIGGLALSANQQKKARRKARDAYNAQQVDRLSNVTTTTAPRALLLGRARVGGPIFFRASTGTNKTTFVECIAIAAHEVDGVESFYLNDVKVTVDGSGNVLEAPYAIARTESAWDVGTGSSQNLAHTPIAGSVSAHTGTIGGPEGDITPVDISGPGVSGAGTAVTTTYGATIQYQYIAYQYNANLRLITGTDTQTADARLQSLFPGVWTSEHRARGVAYIIAEFSYNETSFPTGIPLVTAIVRGAKVYDPRQNLILQSESHDNAAWIAIGAKNVTPDTHVAPDGTTTADTVSDLSAAAYQGIQQAVVVPNDSSSYCYSVYVRKTTGGTAPTFGVNLVLNGGTPVNLTFRVNTDTGQRLGSAPGTIEDAGTYWRVSGYITNNSSGNTFLYAQIYPAVSAYGGGLSDVVTTTGSAVIWGSCWTSGTAMGPYTKTTGSAVTPGTRWTENPALHMRHVYQHPDFGKATVSSDEDSRFVAAANACDTVTAYTVDGTTANVARYRSALSVQFGSPAKDVFDDLAQAMAGSWAFAGGELFIKPGVWTASVMSLTEADLGGVVMDGGSKRVTPIETMTHRERASKFNTVKVQIWDSGQDYKLVPLTPVTDSSLVTRDGATLTQDVSMPAVGYAPQAQHVASVMMRDARDPEVVRLAFKMKAHPLQLFDTIDLTIPRYGWTNKLFQIVGRKWSSDGLVQLTLKGTASQIFDVNAAFLSQGYASNTNLPNPWYVPPVGTLSIYSGTSELVRMGDGTIATRVRITWPAVTDSSVLGDSGRIEVQYRSVISTGEWRKAEVQGSVTQIVISDVSDGDNLIFRARAKTATAVGDWGLQQTHLVLGKTELPSTPTGLSLTPTQVFVNKVSDTDVAGYQIRAIPYGTGDWTRATPLHTGLVTDFPWVMPNRIYGLQTIFVAAVDTSGNVGAAATSTLDYGSADVSNTVQSYDYKANNWPGTLTNSAVSGGNVVANVAGSTDLYSLSDLYGEVDLYVTSYSAMVWQSAPFVPAYGGGTLTLAVTTTGPSAVIEYAIDGDSVGDVYSLADDYSSSDLYGPVGTFRPWIGALPAARMQGVIFRVSIAGGSVQGVISAFTAFLTLPDVTQTFGEMTLSVGGTRLTPSTGTPPRSWVVIRSVLITPVVDGSGATGGRIYDYPPNLGPLAELVNGSGSPVTGRAIVTVGGLADG